jgi:SAM-dependent methyltransferase
MNYTEITKCRACNSPFLVPFLDLGSTPLANNFYAPPIATQAEYPLKAMVCKSCFHCQLSIVVDPDTLFKNYLYVSGTSETMDDYFEWFAEYLEITVAAIYRANNEKKENFRVLDIACNDGTQLAHFRKRGWMTYGCDPAQNLKDQAEQNCDFFYNGYWNNAATEWLLKKLDDKPIDVILAQNVFAHTDDILNFLIDCAKVMSQKTLIIIQTSQANWLKNGEFDYWYHEHLSQFNTKSMKLICERAGLILNRVDKFNIHGTSYVFSIGGHKLLPDNVHHSMAQEKQDGIYRLPTYIKFGLNARDLLKDIKNKIEEERPYKFIGYGATAKSMTVLNSAFPDKNAKPLAYIVDDSPLKQGLLTPGLSIPIVPLSAIAPDQEPQNLCIVATAWNFLSEIKKKVKTLRPNNDDIFLRYFPTVQFEKGLSTVPEEELVEVE